MFPQDDQNAFFKMTRNKLEYENFMTKQSEDTAQHVNDYLVQVEFEDELSPEQTAELTQSRRAAHANSHKGSDWPTVRLRLLSIANNTS